jgi:FkbM family methyltransferase
MPTFREHLPAALTRRYPVVSGSSTFANGRMVRALSGPPSGETWARVAEGVVWVSMGDYVGRSAWFTGDLDRKLTAICRRLVHPGEVVVDIGANVGIVTLLLSKLVGPGGRVHSFEPNPAMQRALDRMVESNGLGNVTLHRTALGARAGELDLVIPAGNAGAASLARQDGPGERCRVPVATLDSIAELRDQPGIRLMKLDVEGFELDVLRGAAVLLKRQAVDVVVFELNQRATPDWRDEPVVQLLAEHGYDFYAIPRTMMRTRLVPAREHGLCSHDMVAAPAGERFRALRYL